MIRLSQYSALHVLSTDVARDLDISPLLYMYSHDTGGGVIDKLLVQEDTSPLIQMSRNNAYAPFYNNVLLGTDNFYPEQGLSIVDYHIDAELHEVMNSVTLPIIEYKRAILYFSQGSVSMPGIVGHSIRIFCTLSNGSEVTIASVVDFLNDSNITAQTPKLFESQIWNEGILIEYIDIESILSSNVTEVKALKTTLFGNEYPVTMHIEFSSFTNESLDVFEESGYQFTRLNLNVINQQSMPITVDDSDLYVQLVLSNDNFSLVSSLQHTKWNVEQYLNTLKEELETYTVHHQFIINSYDTFDALIATNTYTLTNDASPFDEIVFRPVIDITADHFEVEVSVKIENVQTGLIIRRNTTIVVTNTEIQAFQPIHTIDLTGVEEHKITNTVVKEVKTIVHSPEFPKILQIEKKLYVQAQELDALRLLDADFIAKLNVTIDITGNSKTYIKIDNLLIESEENQILTFKIPRIAYLTASIKYLLLDSNQQVISTGKIVKD